MLRQCQVQLMLQGITAQELLVVIGELEGVITGWRLPVTD